MLPSELFRESSIPIGGDEWIISEKYYLLKMLDCSRLSHEQDILIPLSAVCRLLQKGMKNINARDGERKNWYQ